MKLLFPLVALGGMLPLALADPLMGDLVAQADKFLSERAFDQALDSYDKALERQKHQESDALEDPLELSRIMYRRGTVLLLRDKQQLALEDFEAALLLNPDMHKASIKIAESLLRQGDFFKAIQRLEPLGTLKGMDERDRKRIVDGANSGLTNTEAAAKAYQTLLESQEAEDQTPDKMQAELCIQHATEALKVAKKSTVLHRYKANCHMALGQAQSALVDMSYLQAASPSDLELAQDMAQIYFYMLYEPEKALQQIRQKCLRQDPEHKRCGQLAKAFRKREKLLKPGLSILESRRERKPADPLFEKLFQEWVEEGLFDEIAGDTRAFFDTLTVAPIDREDLGSVSNLVARMEEVLCEAYSKQTQKKSNKPPASREVFCDLVTKRDPNYVPAVMLRVNKMVNEEQLEEADRLLAETIQHFTALSDAMRVNILKQRQQEVAVLIKQAKSKDYYKMLGIARDATDKDIKKGYRAQSKLYHPDKYKGDLDATAVERKMAEINEAYEILSDPQKRAAFDNGGEFNGQGEHQHNPFGGGGGGFNFQQGGGGAGFDFAAMFQEQMRRQAQQGRQGGGGGGGQKFQGGFQF